MRYLSRRDLESIGVNVIAAYKVLPQNSGRLERIDIDCLVENLLGLHIDYRHLSRACDTLGLTSFSEIGVEVFPESSNATEEMFYMLDGKTILIESNLIREGANIGRRNYTVAHECCHHIMRRLFPHDYDVQSKARTVHYCYRSRAGARNWEEWQVETLAGIILLPVECVLCGMDCFGLGRRIRLLNRIFAPETYNRFAQMAAFLGVSKTALAIRMEQLNLIERNDLQDPYALLSIDMDEETWNDEPCNKDCQEMSEMRQAHI